MVWPWQARPVSRPRIHAQCCGRSDFAVGTPTASPWFDGETVGVEHKGPVLCCAHCGKFYGLNETGLYEPHPAALPPHWSMAHERARAVELEIKRRADRGRDDPRALNGHRAKALARPVDAD